MNEQRTKNNEIVAISDSVLLDEDAIVSKLNYFERHAEEVKAMIEEIENEDSLTCYNCGAIIRDDYFHCVHTRNGVMSVCSDCYNEECFCCPDCNENFFNDDSSIDYQGSNICSSCSDNYYYCEHCERHVYIDDYNSDIECCCDCERERGTGVESYHNSSYWEYIGDCKPSWRGIWRGIGVELEIDHDESDYDRERDTVYCLRKAYENIKFEHDGSLDYGFEIITQPHTVDEFYKINWQEILHICKRNGYTSHSAETCGLHIHFSRTMFGSTEKKQANAITKLIHFFESYWDDIIKVSRRTERQASEYAAKYGVKGKNEVKKLLKNKDAGRYFAINNTNHKTVEIRIMRGTLKLETFLACVDFCVTLVNNSRKIPWAEIDSASKWLNGVKQGTKDYIISRNAFMEVM